MKRVLIFVSAIFLGSLAKAQNIGIGTTTPNASAILDISSTNKGILLPRLTDTSSVASPVKGLMIYNNANNKLWFYNGNRWQQAMATSGGMDSIWYKTQDSIAYSERKYIGINTDLSLFRPQANLQVTGDFLVQVKLNYTTQAPTPAQTYIMPNTSGTTTVGTGDSVFRIYDPGGTSNYINNSQGNYRIVKQSYETAIKISSVAADWGIAAGDTLWISKTLYPFCRTDYEYRFLAGSADPGEFMMPGDIYYFIFRSNGDNLNGKGFNLKITRLYDYSFYQPTSVAGKALFYHGSDNSFSVGENCSALGGGIAMGYYSTAHNSGTAIGKNCTANNNAFAFGNYAMATGYSSLAMGTGVTASDDYSVAIGYNAESSGLNSVAFGMDAEASNENTVAIGKYATASGYYAMAFGGTASGSFSTSIGGTASGTGAVALRGDAQGDLSLSACSYGIANGYAGTVVGMFNHPVLITAQTNATSTTPLFIVGNGSGVDISQRSNALAVFKNGNTGINTNSPQTKLHIMGGSDANLTNTSGYMVIGDVSGSNVVFDNNEIMARNNGATSTLYLQNSGGAFEIGGTAAKPGGGSWAATSDARLKQNVKPYSDGLQQVLKINPVYYQYNSLSGYNTQKQYVGVLAQELRAIAPYMVGTFTKDKTEYLNVDNTAMTYMLINAVKELSKENEELKARLDKIESLLLKK